MSEVLSTDDRVGAAQPLLIARDLVKHFKVKGHKGSGEGRVRAVDGVSFSVFKGETLGVVGESGCGKSTLARLLMHLIRADSGELIFDGEGVEAPDGITIAIFAAKCRWSSRTAPPRSTRACRSAIQWRLAPS